MDANTFTTNIIQFKDGLDKLYASGHSPNEFDVLMLATNLGLTFKKVLRNATEIDDDDELSPVVLIIRFCDADYFVFPADQLKEKVE